MQSKFYMESIVLFNWKIEFGLAQNWSFADNALCLGQHRVSILFFEYAVCL